MIRGAKILGLTVVVILAAFWLRFETGGCASFRGRSVDYWFNFPEKTEQVGLKDFVSPWVLR